MYKRNLKNFDTLPNLNPDIFMGLSVKKAGSNPAKQKSKKCKQ